MELYSATLQLIATMGGSETFFAATFRMKREERLRGPLSMAIPSFSEEIAFANRQKRLGVNEVDGLPLYAREQQPGEWRPHRARLMSRKTGRQIGYRVGRVGLFMNPRKREED